MSVAASPAVAGIDRAKLLEMYERMVEIRTFEDAAGKNFADGLIPGFVHLYAGEEAVAVGVCAHLSDKDYITSTHRGHGHCIAKGVDIPGMVAELMGKATGVCKGKGGSMHIADVDKGMLGANGIVGGGFPLACGAALTAKTLGTGGVAICFFGDGASNQGTFHEGLNLAAIWKLPVVFVCENNGYAESTPVSYHCAASDIANRAGGYEIPGVVAVTPAFGPYIQGNSAIQRLWTGGLWVEGPAWNAVGRFLLWSDIPNDRQHRWLEDDGHVSVFRSPSGNSNGNTFDWEGRQISCQHGNRRVVRYEHDGSVTVLADMFEGKPFNSPNDAVVHPNGSIFFTDPPYGTQPVGGYEGNTGELHHPNAVYRIDPGGAVERVTDELVAPNGLCFSHDYLKLYIVDTGSGEANIKVFDLVDEKTLANPRVFTDIMVDGKQVGPDAVRADIDGNIWASGGWVGYGFDGIHCFTPEGERIGHIRLPETTSNFVFGGPKRNRLMITASQSIYAVYVNTRGAHIT